MLTNNFIEVKRIVNKKSKEALVLFYNGENTGIGWKKINLKEMGVMLQECQDEFHLLDILEEFKLLTNDLLIEGATFLNADELKDATDKFMEHFKYIIKR